MSLYDKGTDLRDCKGFYDVEGARYLSSSRIVEQVGETGLYHAGAAVANRAYQSVALKVSACLNDGEAEDAAIACREFDECQGEATRFMSKRQDEGSALAEAVFQIWRSKGAFTGESLGALIDQCASECYRFDGAGLPVPFTGCPDRLAEDVSTYWRWLDLAGFVVKNSEFLTVNDGTGTASTPDLIGNFNGSRQKWVVDVKTSDGTKYGHVLQGAAQLSGRIVGRDGTRRRMPQGTRFANLYVSRGKARFVPREKDDLKRAYRVFVALAGAERFKAPSDAADKALSIMHGGMQ